MRVMVVMVVLVMAVMACAIQFADQSPQPAVITSVPTSTATLKVRIVIISLPTPLITTITAPEAMRLRDRPDAAGPVDSIELALMYPGDTFIVDLCRQVNGDWWVYGTFHVKHGWTLAEYLSPNPCEN